MYYHIKNRDRLKNYRKRETEYTFCPKRLKTVGEGGIADKGHTNFSAILEAKESVIESLLRGGARGGGQRPKYGKGQGGKPAGQ